MQEVPSRLQMPRTLIVWLSGILTLLRNDMWARIPQLQVSGGENPGSATAGLSFILKVF